LIQFIAQKRLAWPSKDILEVTVQLTETNNVITQSVIQPWKDFNKTACE